MKSPMTLSGRLLLAMPAMGDPRFHRAVIALCSHDEDGALGIGIGAARTDIGFRDLLETVGIDPADAPDRPIHDGGPVEPGRGFVLHSPEWSDPDTVRAGDRYALSASLDVLQAIAAGRGPERWLMALGYAGWGAGQLDDELRSPGWFVAEAREEIVFATPAQARWAASWKAEGIDPAKLASVAGRT